MYQLDGRRRRADTLPDLEEYLAKMNAAQDRFQFEAANLTAPLGTWEVRPAESRSDVREGNAYITAEKVFYDDSENKKYATYYRHANRPLR